MYENYRTKEIMGVETTIEWLKEYAESRGKSRHTSWATRMIGEELEMHWMRMMWTKPTAANKRIFVLPLEDIFYGGTATEEQIKKLERITGKEPRLFDVAYEV